MTGMILAFLLVFGATAPLSAHEGSLHILGTVTEVTADHVVVQTPDQKTVSIKTTPQTRYLKAKQASTRDALQVGQRIVAEVTKDADGLTASELRVAAGAAKKNGAP